MECWQQTADTVYAILRGALYMRKVILASASPRRRELLSQAGIDFKVFVSEVEEKTDEAAPEAVVKALAALKAQDVYARVAEDRAFDLKTSVVLGADTVVCCDGKVLGKPKDVSDAKRMLKLLSGRKHDVYTGVCMIGQNVDGTVFKKNFAGETAVWMQTLTDDMIEWYISTGEPMDKAGAYGIQGFGAVLVRSIDGDYNNVVGLPLTEVWQQLYHLV